jgi:hypothetical protein
MQNEIHIFSDVVYVFPTLLFLSLQFSLKNDIWIKFLRENPW